MNSWTWNSCIEIGFNDQAHRANNVLLRNPFVRDNVKGDVRIPCAPQVFDIPYRVFFSH